MLNYGIDNLIYLIAKPTKKSAVLNQRLNKFIIMKVLWLKKLISSRNQF